MLRILNRYAVGDGWALEVSEKTGSSAGVVCWTNRLVFGGAGGAGWVETNESIVVDMLVPVATHRYRRKLWSK